MSTLINGYKIKKSKCRAGNATSCFEATAEIERKKSTVNGQSAPDTPQTPGIPNPTARTFASVIPSMPVKIPSSIEIGNIPIHLTK